MNVPIEPGEVSKESLLLKRGGGGGPVGSGTGAQYRTVPILLLSYAKNPVDEHLWIPRIWQIHHDHNTLLNGSNAEGLRLAAVSLSLCLIPVF